jgi:glycosyltransferase involved in cell wall biosynthesis
MTGALRRRWGAFAARQMAQRRMVLLHGPGHVKLAQGEVALVALVRDAAYFLPEFLAHHQRLGVRHVVLVDNGSVDDTVVIAKRFANVTVLRNTLPAKRYEVLLRACAAGRVRGGWTLFADADEMFETPLGASLARLIAYLNAQGCTAMVAQMLDLFSDRPYGVGRNWTYAQVLARVDRYSLGAVTSVPYHDRKTIGFNWFLQENQGDVALKLGGLRREVFGEACFLSKHSLVRNVAGVEPMVHPHCARGVRVADVTGLLRHYKLAGDYLARDRASVAAGTWDHAENAKRLAAAVGGDAFVISPANPKVYAGTDALARQGFLEIPETYRRFII